MLTLQYRFVIGIWISRQALKGILFGWLVGFLFFILFYFILFIYLFLFIFFAFVGLHQGHMEVPRLRVKSERQLPACTTATARWDLSHVCDLHQSSWQRRILDTLSKARDRTSILAVAGWVQFLCATMGAPHVKF